MGVIANAACLVMLEGKRRPYSGKVLQLGKQQIHLTYRQLKYLADQIQFQLSESIPDDLDSSLTDKQFFYALGFSEVESLEFSTSEGANYVLDLNYPTPQELNSKFDLVYDGGTLEHIFDIPVALTSICRMLCIGGRVIHDTPTSGYVDHGFTSIQPTLYYDFYKAQNFEVSNLQISKLNVDTLFTTVGEHISYSPGMFDFAKTWAIDQKIYMTFCAATKQELFQKMNPPQQSLWLRASGNY